jgi:hypothetical protein
MDNDILTDLKDWLGQRELTGEELSVEIVLVNRAIEEIERLRAAQGPPQRWPQQGFGAPAVSGEAANRRYDEHAKKIR